MSACYIVLHVNDGHCVTCETYAGAALAMGRAIHIALNKTYKGVTFMDSSPVPQTFENNADLKWVLYDFGHETVSVYFKHIQVGYLDAQKDPTPPGISIGDMIRSKLADIGKLPQDELFADDMPIGWTEDGKPARVKDMKDDPENIKSTYSLTDDEKWALVTARMSKRPKFFTIIDGMRYAQHNVLDILKARTQSGLEIRDRDIKFIDEFHCDLLDKLDE